MKEKVYYAARISLSGRADLVLFGANMCIEKRLTDKQAKHAISYCRIPMGKHSVSAIHQRKKTPLQS